MGTTEQAIAIYCSSEQNAVLFLSTADDISVGYPHWHDNFIYWSEQQKLVYEMYEKYSDH
jgi:hypothetical protein